MPPKRRPLEDCYDVDPVTGCWNWNKSLNSGYGQISRWSPGKTKSNVTTVKAHREVYERHVGPIPPGLQLDHLCRNPRCVNPAHLEPVTNEENVRRGISTKFTVKDVELIRAEYAAGKISQINLGKKWGVSERCINLIVRGGSWMKGLSNQILSKNNKVGRRQILTDEQQREIVRRYRSGEKGVALAKEFGVSPAKVSMLVHSL